MIALKKSNNCQKTSGFAAVRRMMIALLHFTYAEAGIGGLCIVTPDVVTRKYVRRWKLRRMKCFSTNLTTVVLIPILSWRGR
ncbi:MAG: hypothetical protein CMB24_07200 [Euryarchaeota archaeon]|nr:hypothetical protein [Euryarchaeota archaeon]